MHFDKEEGREVFIKNRAAHFDFRSEYTKRQAKLLTYIGGIMFAYGIIGFLFIGDFILKNRANAKTEYAILMGISLALHMICIFVNRYAHLSKERYEAVYEIIGMFAAVGYLVWAYMVLTFSIAEGRDVNYLPILMVYAICSIFFYFSIHHYFVFYLMCLGLVVYIVNHYPKGTLDYGNVVNVVVFGALLTLGGASKYWTSQYKHQASKEANELRDNLEANNEELKTVNNNLVAATDELKKRAEAQKLFTAGMNHELRSPLNGIIGLLQVLKEDKSLSEEASENVDKALFSSVTLINIVNDLLDFYKLEAGEFGIIPEPFDLRDVVNNVKNVTSTSAEEKNLLVSFDASEDMPCVFKGDSVRIQQIITNVVSNGIKYTEEGFVKTVFSYSDGILSIRVSDSGQGISEEAKGMLFDPFKRFNENRNKYIQGTGLGLSIVKKLIEQMNGDISLESEVNKGTTFLVRLPLPVADSNVKYGDNYKRREVSTEVPDLSGRKFLCVDDNKVNLAVFKGLFKGTNAELKLLMGGKECLEEITKEKYDIIFLDHLMPEMDGVETFEAMCKMQHLNENTPIVMLTANAGAEAEQRYMAKGFNGYLSKPVLRQNLYEMTKKMLNSD